MRVLVTRPEHDARQTAARLMARGHEAAVEPVFTIEPVAFDDPEGSFAAVAATSANAVRAAANNRRLARFRSLPLFVVGAHSAEAAREAGFQDVAVAEGDARSLAGMLADRFPSSRVLYLAGADRAQDLAALVAPGGIEIEILAVYRARAADRLSAAAIAMVRENRIDAVMHYSARSAAAFIALARKEGLDLGGSRVRHLCLSEAVAIPLRDAGADAETAARPDESALFALLDP